MKFALARESLRPRRVFHHRDAEGTKILGRHLKFIIGRSTPFHTRRDGVRAERLFCFAPRPSAGNEVVDLAISNLRR